MAAYSGRLRDACAPAHTGSGRKPSDSSYRVAKRSSDRFSAREPCLQASQWHPRVAKGLSIGSSARHPRPQVVLRQGRVTKGTSIGTSARGPCPQVPQCHPRVAKGVFCPAIEPFAHQDVHPVHQPKPSFPAKGSSGSSAQAIPPIRRVSRPLKGSFCPSGESFCPSGWSFCQHIHAEGGIFGNGI